MISKKLVKKCKDWFKDNNVIIPRTAKEWSKCRSGITIPPGCTYGTLRRLGVSVGDLLSEINSEYSNRVSSKPLQYSEVGLEYISRSGIELIKYKCLSCGSERETLLGTLKRWAAKKQKFCSICRKAGGAPKSLQYYKKFLDSKVFEAIERISGENYNSGHLRIKHLKCGKEFQRALGYITGTQRSHDKLVICPHCSDSKYFIHNKIDNFTSLKEKEIIEHLYNIFPNLTLEREVMYNTILKTDRMYRLDVWYPSLKLGFEITTDSNNIPGYFHRMEEKLQLANSQNINIFKVTTKTQAEDIVRAVLKDTEG